MQFTLHTSFPDELAFIWNQLLEKSITHVPFLRYEYLKAWWQTRGGGEWSGDSQLALVTAHQGDTLVGAAPLFLAKNRQNLPALLLVGSIEVTDYLDFVVTPEQLQPFLNGLLPYLETELKRRWQVLDCYNLLESSPSLSALKTTAEGMGWRMSQERLQHSPYIPLPGDWETYLESIDKKQRHEIRRKMRRFEAADVPTGWTITQDLASLDADMDAFMGLMAQDPEKAAFLTPIMRQHMKLTARCAFEQGCLNLAFLEVNGEKAAAYFSFNYLNRLWVYNSGIDRHFMEYSPGWVLLGNLLRWANEHQFREFDFMRGDEEYKYRFGAVDRFVVRAVVEKG